MNIFAGNFSVKNPSEIPDIDFDIIQSSDTSFFIMGADANISSHADIKKLLENNFWELTSYDISLEPEDTLEILSSEYEDGVYECVTFEWPKVNFEDILERFAESSEVICVREAETSEKYGNRIIKADFIY